MDQVGIGTPSMSFHLLLPIAFSLARARSQGKLEIAWSLQREAKPRSKSMGQEQSKFPIVEITVSQAQVTRRRLDQCGAR